MTLQIYIARLPHHGGHGYTGPDRLDLTRGTGGAAGRGAEEVAVPALVRGA